MGDDVGWFNIGAYHRGIMSGKTPNLDQLAAKGMMFTDYYDDMPTIVNLRQIRSSGRPLSGARH
jgi:hypothetical protein